MCLELLFIFLKINVCWISNEGDFDAESWQLTITVEWLLTSCGCVESRLAEAIVIRSKWPAHFVQAVKSWWYVLFHQRKKDIMVSLLSILKFTRNGTNSHWLHLFLCEKFNIESDLNNLSTGALNKIKHIRWR